MSNLTNRSNPFEGLVPLHDAVNSLFEQSFLTPSWRNLVAGRTGSAIPLDVYEDNDNYFVVAALPGIDPNKVEITAQDGALTIQGEIPSLVPEGKQVVWHELLSGQFMRSFTLPAPVDAAHVQAAYDGGLLKLIVPKAEHAKPRRIPISSGSTQGQLTAAGAKS
jgi:HSP20 family protein